MRRVSAAILLIVSPVLASAQGYGSSKWEFYVSGLYQDSESVSGGGGSGVDFDSDWGLGLTLNYKLTPKLAVGGDFEFVTPRYTAALVNDEGETETFRHTANQFTGRLKATYEFTENDFSPYVEAGVGWTQFDSNVADGDPLIGCWWHPWWGYICNGFYDTITETNFSYGGALGIRYRVSNGSMIKLGYNTYQLDGSSAEVDPTLSAWRLEWGWEF